MSNNAAGKPQVTAKKNVFGKKTNNYFTWLCTNSKPAITLQEWLMVIIYSSVLKKKLAVFRPFCVKQFILNIQNILNYNYA